MDAPGACSLLEEKGVKIRLTRYEMELGAIAGIHRKIEAVIGQYSERRYGAKPQNGFWDVEIEAVGAELATAKYLGIYWSGTVNTFQLPDVGTNYQVRHTHRVDGRLIVRCNDSDKAVFILVTGKMPDYCIKGWMLGVEAKNDKWLFTPSDSTNMAYGTQRQAAYFVPQEQLKNITELRLV